MFDGFSFYFSCLEKISGDERCRGGAQNFNQKLVKLQSISSIEMELSLFYIFFIFFCYSLYSKR